MSHSRSITIMRLMGSCGYVIRSYESTMTGARMTGHQSLQFLEHLRQSGRLREPAAATEHGATDRLQDAAQRDPNSGSHRKLWEMVDLPAAEFADEAARFYQR